MSRRQHSPWFVFAVVLAGVIFVAEVVWIYRCRQTMVRAELQVKLRERDMISLARIDPMPTEAVVTAIATDVAKAETAYRELQSKLQGGKKAAVLRAAQVPKERTDAYIDLAAYFQKMQSAARKQGVSVSADERFGFKSYANEGPEQAMISPVFQQRQVLQYLLEQLFAVRPEALTAVRRGLQNASKGPQAGKDSFVMPPALSLRRPGYIDTTAFQIAFRGDTEVLRQWLNKLAKYELPIVVRAVEVDEPENRQSGRPAMPSSGSLVLGALGQDAVSLVKTETSHFTVTLEYLQLVEPVQGGQE